MKLYALGTAGYHPNNERQTSCYYLPEVSLMLDAGSGLHRLLDKSMEWQFPNDRLDIFLSHAHLDHIVGLTFLLDVFYATPIKNVRIFAEQKKIEAIREHLFSESIFPVLPNAQWIALDENSQPIEVGGEGKLTSFPLSHPGGSRGLRIDWPNAALGYVTDTTASPDCEYQQHLEVLDLLIHECNFTDEMPDLANLTGHSCTSQVAALAARVRPKKLILSHVNPIANVADPVDIRAAQAIFPDTTVAMDKMLIEF